MRLRCFVLLAVLLPLPATAQDFQAVRDTLVATRDTAALQRSIGPVARSTDPALLVRAGLIEMRLYELTADRAHAQRARARFDRARDVAPRLAWAHYGWALAMMPEIDRPVGSGRIVAFDELNVTLGTDPRSRARRALERAVALDPSLTDAAALLATLGDETHDEEATQQARGVLERQFASTGDATAGLGLARAAGALGDHEAAAAAARQVAARDSLRSAEAHYTAARALFRLPNRLSDAVTEYFLGVSTWDDLTAERYYRDVEMLVTEKEALLWAGADLAGRRAWLREFWELRAALGGVTANDRIAEHYRRLDAAHRLFVRGTRYGAPPTGALEFERLDDRLDDRGVIYIRHGAPRDVIRTVDRSRRITRAGAGLPAFDPEESWVYYDDAGEPVMYNFKRYGSLGYDSYVLLHLLPCRGDFLESRLAYAPELFRLMGSCHPSVQRNLSQGFRRDAREALRTDSHRPAFTVNLPFHYDVLTFRGASGFTDVVTSISVEGERMRAQVLANGGAAYALGVRVAVVDTVARTSARRDTVLRVTADAPLTGDQRLRAHVAVSMPPTPGAIHRAVLQDAFDRQRGQAYGAPLDVPDYAPGTPAMSDLVLAAPDSTGSFVRGDVSLSLVPWGAFPGGAFRIFYELYDLTPGGVYRTELRVVREGGGLLRLFRNDTPIRLGFEETAPDDGSAIQQLRDVQTELPPGEYRLIVKVTDVTSGVSFERERALSIPKP